MHNRLLSLQAILVLGGVIVASYFQGQAGAIAAFYGGAIALISTLLLAWRVRGAGKIAEDNPKHSVYTLYYGALERFVFVLVALPVGLGALDLSPIPLLLTFGIAQLAYMVSGGLSSHSA